MINCTACSSLMSQAALACPRCGHPNKAAVQKQQNGKQAMGCLFVLLAVPAVIFPPLSAIMFIVGVVLILINTRVW